jgi:hypothetical protein
VVLDYDPKTRAFADHTGQTAGRSGWLNEGAVSAVHELNRCCGLSRYYYLSRCRSLGRFIDFAGAAVLYEAIVGTVADLPARRAALARASRPSKPMGSLGRTRCTVLPGEIRSARQPSKTPVYNGGSTGAEPR